MRHGRVFASRRGAHRARDEHVRSVPGRPSGSRCSATARCMAAADIVAGDGDAEDLAYEIYWHAAYSQLPELRPVADRFLELYVGWGPAFDQDRGGDCGR